MTKKKVKDFEVAVRKLEGKCIDCGIQFVKAGSLKCGLCGCTDELQKAFEKMLKPYI